MSLFADIRAVFKGDAQADRAVPPTGFTARLTLFSAGAMAFLAVFAMALSLATGRLADRWSSELARSATVRISAPEGQVAAQTKAAVAVLETTPGVAEVRVLDVAEQRALLEPWFGPDLPLDTLPIPQMIDVIESARGYDSQGLRLRLQAEAPGAVLDDHTRWRKPLVRAADRLRVLGYVSILLIAATTAAMITLAAQCSPCSKCAGDPRPSPCRCARCLYRARVRAPLYPACPDGGIYRHGFGHDCHINSAASQ